MANMKQAVARHNTKIENKEEEVDQLQPGCNCNDGVESCPMEGNCLIDKLVYKSAVVDSRNILNTYTGLTSMTFKQRYYGHTSSFRNRGDKDNSTTLSTYIWKLKDEGLDFDMSWSVVDRGNPFNPTTRKCRLCLNEKFHIIFQPAGATLNKRSELFSTCRHRLRKLLANT